MAWFLYDGKRVFFTEKKYSELKRAACEKYGVEYNTRYTFVSKDSRNKEQEKKNQDIFDALANYIREMPNEKQQELLSFNFYNDEAQEISYDLLGDFCELNSGIRMSRMGYNGDIIIPSSVDIYLPLSFGRSFFLSTTKKVMTGLLQYSTIITSSVEIVVPNITGIKGSFTHFYICFNNGMIIELSNYGRRNNVDLVVHCIDASEVEEVFSQL